MLPSPVLHVMCGRQLIYLDPRNMLANNSRQSLYNVIYFLATLFMLLSHAGVSGMPS